MTIYVVQGHTGEYSDQNDWIVKAFTDEKIAQDFVAQCTEAAKEIEVKYPYFEHLGYRSAKRDAMESSVDPKMEMDYTGTCYGYEAVELI